MSLFSTQKCFMKFFTNHKALIIASMLIFAMIYKILERVVVLYV